LVSAGIAMVRITGGPQAASGADGSSVIGVGQRDVWGHGTREPYPAHAAAQLVERARGLFAAA
jgi:hypothetical protein